MNKNSKLPPRLLLIGWDSATWDLLRPWMEQGRLPNLAALVRSGVQATLPSVASMNSGPAWSSIITGVNPGRHGIFNLFQNDPGVYQRRPMHGSDRHAPALWTRLSAAGYRVGVVNVPVSFPADPVNGVMISGMDTPFLQSPGVSHPPELMSEILSAVGRYEIAPNIDVLARAGRLDAARDLLMETFSIRLDAVRYLMKTRPWDFFMVVFNESDWAQHFLWPPDGGDATQCLRLRQVFERMDEGLGQLRAEAGPDTTIVLMSDHGAGPAQGAIRYLIPLLARLGYLKFGGRKRKQALLQGYHLAARLFNHQMRQRLIRWFPRLFQSVVSEIRMPPIDWSATRVYMPLDGREMYINLQGRKPQGVVQPDDYGPLREEIIQLLYSLIEVGSGQPVIKRVWRWEEVYSGPETHRGPDLVLDFAHDGPVRGVRFGDVEVLEPQASFLAVTGGHRMDGIFVVAGPEVRVGEAVQGLSLYDITPTVCYLLDHAVPLGLDGRVCEELVASEALAQRPVRYGPDPFDSASVAGAGLDAADESAVVERLRGLGYLE